MGYKNKLLIGIILIIIVCFVDYQFFTEGRDARRLDPLIRQAAHLIVLAVVTPIGYWSWKGHPMPWTKSIWLISYIAAIIILLLVGLIEWQTGVFSNEILDRFYDFRLFFGSPLAFMILYMLTVLVKRRA